MAAGSRASGLEAAEAYPPPSAPSSFLTSCSGTRSPWCARAPLPTSRRPSAPLSHGYRDSESHTFLVVSLPACLVGSALHLVWSLVMVLRADPGHADHRFPRGCLLSRSGRVLGQWPRPECPQHGGAPGKEAASGGCHAGPRHPPAAWAKPNDLWLGGLPL